LVTPPVLDDLGRFGEGSGMIAAELFINESVTPPSYTR